MRILIFRFIVLWICLALSLSTSVLAKSQSKIIRKDNKEDFDLIKRIAKNPTLLNPAYIQCYTGPQTKTMIVPQSKNLHCTSQIKRTYWFGQDESYERYTFEQNIQNLPKSYIEFSINPSFHDYMRVKELSKILDKKPQKAIDAEGHQAALYTLDNNLKVWGYEQDMLVNLSKIAVQYIGPPLLPPSQSDMQEAITYKRKIAFEHARLANHRKGIPLLQSYLQMEPGDMEAHLKLAECYKAGSFINPAINEYRLVLANTTAGDKLNEQAIAGLASLKVDIPGISSSQSISEHNNINSSVNSKSTEVNPAEIQKSALPTQSSTTPTSSGSSNIKSLDVGF